MSVLENRLEIFRGQIEELQGKMQEALGQLEGPRGTMLVLRGRAMQMRGKARQAMGKARVGAAEVTESLREHPERALPYGGLLVLGLGIIALAIFSPQTLSRIWDTIRRPVMQMAGPGMETETRPMR